MGLPIDQAEQKTEKAGSDSLETCDILGTLGQSSDSMPSKQVWRRKKIFSLSPIAKAAL